MGRGGERISEIRSALGVSQEELADLLKVTRDTVGRWERGTTEPKYELVAKAEQLLSKRGGASVAAESRASYGSRKKKRGA